jgi:hypothetical protein
MSRTKWMNLESYAAFLIAWAAFKTWTIGIWAAKEGASGVWSVCYDTIGNGRPYGQS